MHRLFLVALGALALAVAAPAEADAAMGGGGGNGMGLGLGGAKRLVNDFSITSEAGKGTRVEITRWK